MIKTNNSAKKLHFNRNFGQLYPICWTKKERLDFFCILQVGKIDEIIYFICCFPPFTLGPISYPIQLACPLQTLLPRFDIVTLTRFSGRLVQYTFCKLLKLPYTTGCLTY